MSLVVALLVVSWAAYDFGIAYPEQHAQEQREFATQLQNLENKPDSISLTESSAEVRGSVAGISQVSQEVESVNQDSVVDPVAKWLPDSSWQEAVVERVVDGDTLVVSIAGKSERVRLVGIDAPEMGSSSTRECLSQESKLLLQELVEGKTVWLQPDATQADRDRYNRSLRFAFLDDGSDVGQQLLIEGLATEYLYSKQPHQYRELYLASQKTAQDRQKNLWNNELCPLQSN